MATFLCFLNHQSETKWKNKSKAFASIFSVFFMFMGLFSAQAQFNFSDQASNYGGTWPNNSNFGTGYNAWAITTGGVNAGTFIGNPSSNGMGTTGIGTTAHGLFGHGGNSVNAVRYFGAGGNNVPMQIGDVFSFHWAMNWDAGGGFKGFDLRADVTNIFNVNNGGSSAITTSNGTADPNYGTTPMLVTLTRTSWTQYSFTMTSRSGGATYSTTINSSANINNINIYCGNQSDNNGNRNIYFNNFNFTKAAPYETNFDVTDPRVLAGTNNLTKTGAGNLTLTGVNTFTGNVIVNANALIITNDNQLGAAPGVATADKIQIGAGTLRVNASITINANRGMTLNNAASTIDAVGAFTATYNGIIAGTGNLTKAESGTLILGGTNTYTGTTTIATGVLRINNINALGTTAGGTTVASGAALELNAGADYPAEPLTLNGTGISNGGALRKTSTGTQTFGGSITLNSDARINVDGGTLTYTGALNINSNTLYIGGNQNFDFNTASSISNASKTTGDGAIYKNGTGTLFFRPSAALTGNITLVSGEIRHLVNVAYPSSGLLIFQGGTYRSDGVANRTVEKPTRVDANFTIGHTSGGSITFSGNMNLNGATRTLTMANNNTISGAISNGGLTKAGAGSLTLSGSNTYAGNTNINVGNLTAASAGAFGGDTDVFIANAATLTVSASTSAASVREAGVANSGTVILNTGTILTINGANKGTFFQNSISGAGGLTMAGSGTTNMNLFGTQSYTGVTTVSGGQLTSPVAMATSSLTVSGGVFSAGGANILGNTIPVTVNGGTYQLGGTQTLGSLAGTGGTVSLSASTLTTGNDNTNTTYSGVISGTGGLTKIGTGAFTLDGTVNTYTGNTTVNNGTLTVGATNVINAASNLVLTNGTFNLSSGADLTLNSANMTGGAITRAGDNSLTFNNPSSFTGGTVTYSSTGSIVTTGTTTLGNVTFNSTSTSATTHNTLRLGGDIIVNNNTTANFTNTGGSTGVRFNLGDAIRTINVGTNAFLNIDWRINSTTLSSGGITKIGTGRLTLSYETNVYSGSTTITAGELRLNPANTVASWASPITLNGGTLSTTGITAGTNITNASAGVTLNLNANSSINLGSVNHSITFANSSAVSWSGTDLTIFGWTGTVGLSGTNGRIFFGNTSGGLTSDQLSKITFDGYASSAILLNTGELVPANSSLYFRTVSSGDWATPATWEAADNPSFTSAFAPTYVPNNSNSLLIQIRNAHTITVTSNTVADDLVIDAGGVLTVSSGTFTIANGSAATDLLINGTFNANSTLVINSGSGVTNNNIWQTSTSSVTSTGSSITQSSTAIYNHAADGGTIPISTWNTGSLLRITGINTSSTIGGMGQTFHNIEYDCPSQTVTSVQLQGAINAINGNFTMTSTGGAGRELRFFANGSNTNSSLTIQGNLTMTAGRIAVTNSTSNGSATPILNINGNLSISGTAIFDLTGNSAFTATSSTVNLGGDLTINGSGTILRTQTTPSTFRFNRTTGSQTYTATTPATAISTHAIIWQVGNGTTQPVLNLANNFAMNASSGITVQNGARLNCGTSIVTGNTFTMNSGSALGIGSPQGIVTAPTAAGNIQTTTRTYHLSNGSYYYMGSADQVTGNGLPNTMTNQINTLGIETTGGARVTQNTPDFVSVVNTLQLNSGIYILNTNDLRLLQAATVSGTPSASAMVVTVGTSRYAGRLMKLFTNPSFTGSFTFPLGDITGTVEYSPVTLNLSYTGSSAPNYYAMKSVNAKQSLDPSITNFLNRHWQGSAHTNWYGATGTANMTFTYLPADVVGTASLLKHNRFGWSGGYAGQWFEDAGSSSASNILTSATLSLEEIRDVDHVGRLFQPLYFQSNVASGIWETASSWLVSTDPTFVSPPGVVPSVFPIASNSEGIRILNAHNIIYNSPISAPLTADQAIINAGGTLTMNTNAALFLLDGIGTDLEVNGNLVLLGGNSFVGQNPTYTATSNLIYSTGTNNVGNEWTGNNTSPGFGVPNDVTILSGTVNMPNTNRGLARDISINSGTLNLNASSGDLYVGRNWNRVSTATFNGINRAVFFNGSGAQSIAVTGGGTQSFPYLQVTKPSGSLTISNSPATDVNVTASSGTIMGINNTATFDLNGRTLSFTGTSGNINANGGVTQIIGSAGSVINISGGTKTMTQTGSGSFQTGANVSINLSNGLNFNGAITTVLGTVRINAGGFVSVNPPVYGTGSTLIYETGGAYGVGSEWTSTTSGPAALGRPHHVIAQTSTVNMPAAARALAGDLTINSTFNLNTSLGGDLFILGNLVNNGTLNTNNRQMSFTGVSGIQSISGTAATSIDFLEVNNLNGLELQRNVTVDDRVLFTNGTLILNNFNLTHNRVFSPAFQGVSSSRFVVTNGTGRLIQQVATLNVDFPIGPNSSSYNPMLINQQATAEQIGIRALITPPFTHALVDPNQMVNVEYNINESVNGANNIFTQFNWNGANEASAFIRSSGVFHGHWNGTEWAVRPSSATSGGNPYQSNSTVNFTGTLGSGGTNFAIGNINAFFSCILTQGAGNWENPSTWVLGVVPPTDASVCIAHPITVNASDAEISNVVINTGGGLTIQPGRTLRILNNGALVNNSGISANLGSGTLRFNGIGSTSGPNSVVLNNLEIFGNTSLNTSTTVNGNLTVNLLSFVIVGSPIYGPSATLIYNPSGSYNVGNEWTGNSLTPGTGIPLNVTIQNGTTLNMPTTNRGIGGDLSINSGTLNLNATSGDLFVGGNWTRNNTATFNPNNRAVFFNGTGNQTIAITGGGTASFAYLFVNKTAGSLVISNSPATDVTVTGPLGGNIFGFNNISTFDLNGRTLSFNGGPAGNINTSGGSNNFLGSAGSTIIVSGGTKTITSTGGGTLNFGSNVTINLSGGVNFGSNLSTINGTLRMLSGGFVTVNAPFYTSTSTLHYNNGVFNYGRGIEWSETSGAGYPFNVLISRNVTITQLDLNNSSSALRQIAGNLTISDGGVLAMNAMTDPLVVLGNVVIGDVSNPNGASLVQGSAGADLRIGGNLLVNTGATFNQNTREVEMIGAAPQTITNVGNFNFLKISNTGSTVSISNNTGIVNRLWLNSGTLDLNGFEINLANNSSIRRSQNSSTMSANPTIGLGFLYDLRYDASITAGNEFIPSSTQVRDVEINNGTLTLNANRTFNRDLILNSADLNLNGFTMTARGRATAPAFSGSINVSGGGTRNITGPVGSQFDITGLGGNNPTDYTKTIATFGGTLLNFDSNVLVRIGDGSVDFGLSGSLYPTTINGTLQVLLGGSVGQILNPCYYGVNSILRFANTVDYQVGLNDKTWATGSILSGNPGIPYNVEVFDNGTDLTLDNTRALRGNLTINNGTFTLSTNYTSSFNIGGNWTRIGASSNFTHNNKLVVFDGLITGNQFITVGSGVSAETFYDLQISPASGIITLGANSNLNVLNNLNFTSSKLDLASATNTLRIGNASANGSITGYDATRYIISNGGKLRLSTNSNANYVFPIGDATDYTRFELNLTAGATTGAYIDGTVFNNVHPNFVPMPLSYINRYWRIEPTGLTTSPVPAYSARYYYAATDVVGTGIIKAVKYSYSNPTPGWLEGPPNSGGGPANGAEGSSTNHDTGLREFEWNGLQSFSDFTGAGDGGPLPITLIAFNAQPVNNTEVLTTWSTASEINNHYFTIYRSKDAVHYEEVGKVDGSGNSNVVRSYQLIDPQPHTGISYYKLRQTDFNGDFEEFAPVAVILSNTNVISANVFPNPTSDVVSVTLNSKSVDQGLIKIFDVAGALVWQQNIQAKDGANLYQFDVSSLAVGKYIISVKLNSNNMGNLPLIINR